MKRLVCMLLCLALSLTAVAALAATPAELVGRWYFVTVDGKDILEESYVEFNRNKSVTLVLSGDTADFNGCTWNATDSGINLYDAEGEYLLRADLEDGRLKLTTKLLTTDGRYYDYVLARERITHYLPAIIQAESEEALFGEYQVVLVLSNDLIQEADEGTIITIDFAQISENGEVYLTDFVDGRLVVYENKKEMYISATEDPAYIVAYYEEDPEGAEQVYLKKTEADADQQAASALSEAVEAASEAVAEIVALFEEAVAVEEETVTTDEEAVAVEEETITTDEEATDALEPFYGSYDAYLVVNLGNNISLPSGLLTVKVDENGAEVNAYGKTGQFTPEVTDGVATLYVPGMNGGYDYVKAYLSADTGELVAECANEAGEVQDYVYFRLVAE